MDMGLAGKLALITGGAGEPGLAAARLLKAQGVRIVLADKDTKALLHAANRLGGVAAVANMDLARNAEVNRLAADLRGLGGCDILVHSTARQDGDAAGPTQLAWETEFLSAVRLARSVVPQMVEGGWGRVVFLSPVLKDGVLDDSDAANASDHCRRAQPGRRAQLAARASLQSFARGASRSYEAKGVRFQMVPAVVAATVGLQTAGPLCD